MQNIKIVGCGGASIGIIHRLGNMDDYGVETIVIDIDGRYLHYVRADRKVLMKTPPIRGHITYCWPTLGKQAAELSGGMIREALGDASLVLIVAGLGGSTATGAIPVIARMAREQGAIVLCVLCLPFKLEKVRRTCAEECIVLLKAEADMVIMLDNHMIFDLIPGITVKNAYAVIDQVMLGMVRDIVEAIADPGHADLTSMGDSTYNTSFVVMVSGETGRAEKLVGIARKAMNQIEFAIRVEQSDRIPDKDQDVQV